MKKRAAKINKKEDFIDELKSMIPPERAERAKREAEKEIFYAGSILQIELIFSLAVFKRDKTRPAIWRAR